MNWQQDASLSKYCLLRVGGRAERLIEAHMHSHLVSAARDLQVLREKVTILGWGSNILPSDAGISGAVLVNKAREISVLPGGVMEADSGAGFQDLFLKSAQAGLSGLEFAVGIPGTLGGALVSNAGAYRNNISDRVVAVEWVRNGVCEWVDPSEIEFSYRDSILRRPNPPAIVLTRVRLQLEPRDRSEIYNLAREFQRQRISKQPPQASVGSFFKNVLDADLARELPTLPDGLKEAGVIPAGYLLEQVGMKGKSAGGAKFSERHANFLVNLGWATATSLRSLAEHAKRLTRSRFGVELEEEALYLGDWSGFEAQPIS